MSDLLERLRHPVFILEDGFPRLHIPHTVVAMTEAHAEIERLREEVERLTPRGIYLAYKEAPPSWIERVYARLWRAVP